MSNKLVFPPIDNPLAREFLLQGGTRGVLLLHGFTASAAQMRPLGEALHREGYTVLGALLPGHGTSVEELERTGWTMWLKAARDSFNRLAGLCSDISVLGLSLGALLTLILAEELPVRAAVPIAAPMRLINRRIVFAPVVWPVARYHDWPRGPETVGAKKENPYHVGYPVAPVRRLGDLMRLERLAERGLPRIRCPLLVVQPVKDAIVMQTSPDVIVRGAVNSPYKEILRLNESRHACTVEPEFEKLYGVVSRFLKES